jgi:hypothetical protein
MKSKLIPFGNMFPKASNFTEILLQQYLYTFCPTALSRDWETILFYIDKLRIHISWKCWDFYQENGLRISAHYSLLSCINSLLPIRICQILSRLNNLYIVWRIIRGYLECDNEDPNRNSSSNFWPLVGKIKLGR